MFIRDLIRLTLSSLVAYRMRSFLTGLGIAIGIAAVILLTSIGEGLHRFVLSEFTQFGTNIIAVQPGKTQTHGASVGVFGSVRPLSIEDAEALRRVPDVDHVTAVVQGNAEIRANGKSRRVTVYGVGAEFPQTFQSEVQIGTFCPARTRRMRAPLSCWVPRSGTNCSQQRIRWAAICISAARATA